MCGIAGLIQPARDLTAEQLQRAARQMASSLQHRGPDSSGVYADPSVGLGLGFRRLAIQDLSQEGEQPMVSASGRYVIVYNGEVYNFRELRDELERRGVGGWRGGSDTEVMLAVVEHRGLEAALATFEGMFAFALLDKVERKLYLVRDRMGEKPLYYGWNGRTLVFGSELKALTALPGWNGRHDPDALAGYMRFGYVPAPYSIYDGIRKLLPGHCISFDLERLTPGVLPASDGYWNARAEVEAGARAGWRENEDKAVETLEDLLSASIGRRLISDVPLGVFLSGGVDSSTVAALATKASSASTSTFTIGFEDSRFDESGHAAEIATHLGTTHTTLTASPETLLEFVQRMPTVYDEPFADASQLPTLLLAELTRKHVTVALSGDGGDELFAGYPRYQAAAGSLSSRRGLLGCAVGRAGMVAALLPTGAVNRLSLGQRPWRLGDKLHRLSIDAAATTPEEVYLSYVTRWRTAAPPCRADSIGYYAQPQQFPDLGESIDRMAFADSVSYLPDDLLVKVDRATMAVGLEGRAPLLDHNVVRFAWRLPLTMKLRDGVGKYLLRRVLYRHVPQALVDRPKQGFEPPLGEWLRGPLREWAESLMSPDVLEEDGPIDPKPVRAIWREHIAGVRDWRFELWHVLMFQAWRAVWRG